MCAAYAYPVIDERLRLDRLNVLIVDDERAVREGCQEIAQGLGFHALTAENAASAYKHLESGNIHIVILDMKLPGASGLEVLQEIKRRCPEAVVVVITAYATVHSAVQAMKQGAHDYITKPFSLEELKQLLQRTAGNVKQATENRLVRERAKLSPNRGNLIGSSPEMEKLFRVIAKVAQSTHPVLILGESGTGKELVARSVHFSGPNRDKPFIPVDCGSLVPTLIESELFGYVKGAFTGAVRAKEGLLAIAEGGTVFLDEIGELPIDLQAKLLRALQEKEIRPVGSTRNMPINVRIVAATNRDLEFAVQQGTFRKDLFFRLNVVNLRIPPLRERKPDIPLLVEHFIQRLNRTSGVDRIVSEEAMKQMVAYDWPGNIRELENCLERAGALTTGPVIHIADLPSQVQGSSNGNGNHAPHAVLAPFPAENQAVVISIAELERRAILSALSQVNGDKLLAAKLLGIGKTTLYRKLKEYGAEA